jgi:Zn-dependent peptidase ImmA (M78 family)
MASRDELLRATKMASDVYQKSGAADRIHHGGYTRVDPFLVAASSDVQVMLQPMESLLGAFIRDDVSGILVNADRPPGLVHMTCAHELGHYFMGHQSNTDQTLDYGKLAGLVEKEADWFAYQLLMPRSLIVQTMRRKNWNIQTLRDPGIIYQLSLRLGTSYQATVWSLYRNNLLKLSQLEVSNLAKIQPSEIKQRLTADNTKVGYADVWSLDKSDQNLVIEARPSDHFVLNLPSHSGAGYLWSLPEALQAGFTLRPVTVSSQTARKQSEGNPTIGQESLQRYRLDPVDAEHIPMTPERLNFEFQENRPWAPLDTQIDRFRTSAEFEELRYGLSRFARERLLEELIGS